MWYKLDTITQNDSEPSVSGMKERLKKVLT